MSDKRREPDDVFIAERTIGRRTLLEWLGKGAVLALGGSALASCLGPLEWVGGEDGGPGPDGGGGGGDVSGSDEFPFSPQDTDQEVLRGWGERTVDPQELQSILRSWRLVVDGLVAERRIFTFADLVALPRLDPVVDFHCVEGWSIYDVPWNGVHLSTLFEQVRPSSGATHVTFHTLGGAYNESLPLEVALEPRTLLGYGIGGFTLPLKHGFPLRLVVPRLLAYKSAKFVERIELTDAPLEGYWVQRGYPYDAEVPASRLRPDRY